ncbi:MAG: hypothetical protein MRJ93_05725 [Nitrososphaeraceae archaeon]|nr:hypothetical protein [Nitrososphaeraceae archaeon]
MKILLLVLPIMLILIFLNPSVVFAHQTVQIGNLTLEVGWVNEPPMIDLLNQVWLSVSEEDNPIRNALKDVSTSVTYGGLSKELRFLPSEQSAGAYVADIIPKKIGSYSLSINGKINDQNVDTKVAIEDVETTDKLAFPIESSGTTESTQNIAKQMGPLINDISKQIRDSNNEINSTQSLIAESLDKIDSIQKDIDVIYLMIYVAIALGAAGIILSFYRTKIVA